MGNAYDNASLIVTPNAYKASKIYALKPTDGSGDLSFSRAGSKMVRNSAGLWETIGTNIPPLNYPVGGGCPSWLFEAEAENIFFRSNDKTIIWIKGATTIGSSPTSPSSDTSAQKIEETTSTDFHQVYQDKVTSVATYTFSSFFKVAERSRVQLSVDTGGSNPDAIFDLTAITIINQNNCTASIEDNGNGWVKCSITFTSVSGTVYPLIRLVESGTTVIYAGTLGSGIYVWNSQLELGSTATSPIITAGSSVTRLADVSATTGMTALIGQTEGTIFWEGNLPTSQTTTYKSILNIEGSKNISITTFSTVIDIISSPLDLTVPFTSGQHTKIAITYSGNILKVFVNGEKKHDVSVYVAGTFSILRYGVDNAGTSQSDAAHKKAVLYLTALSDEEAIALTTI